MAEKGDRSNYISFDFYCRSIQFAFNNAASFDIRIGNEAPTTVSFHNTKRILLSWSSVAEAISAYEVLKRAKVNFIFDQEAQSVVVKSLRNNKECSICLNPFLSSLGLLHNMQFKAKARELQGQCGQQVCQLTASNDFFHVNPNQFIRCDDHFQRMKGTLESDFTCLHRNKNKNKKLSSLPGRHSARFFFDDDGTDEDLMPTAPARNGFVVVVDYLITIAFFGACYQPTWCEASRCYSMCWRQRKAARSTSTWIW